MKEPIYDPELEALIERLRRTPERDPQAVARGRARFQAEVENLFEPVQAQPFWKRLWQSLIHQRSKEKSIMATHRQKITFSSALALIVILVVLLGGASATAYAAQSALPGEALYPVKTGIEQTRVSLSRSSADQAELQLAFAQRRLDEIARLIEQGRFDEIQLAAAEFEAHVQQAIDALQTVSLGDPLRARELAGQIANSLSTYASTLSGMLVSVPEPVRPAVEQALQAAQTGDQQAKGEMEFSGPIEAMDVQAWTVAGLNFLVNGETEIKGSFSLGDLVKVHAFTAEDGSLTAREIEPAAPAADDNLNGNDNNANINSNDDGDGDDHGNDNRIEDDHSNLNSNDDMDNHGNDNGTEDEPSNLNGNEDNSGSSLGGETRFVGVVQTISGDSWVVNGISLQVNSQTDIRGAITVGEQVEVRALRGSNGELIALRLEIDSSGSLSSSSGSSGDDQSNTNTSTNSNDDGGNTNLNANSTDDGGQSGSSNTNTNTNDDHSGSGSTGNSNSSNTNDDHSGSGGGGGSGSGGGGSNDDNTNGHN